LGRATPQAGWQATAHRPYHASLQAVVLFAAILPSAVWADPAKDPRRPRRCLSWSSRILALPGRYVSAACTGMAQGEGLRFGLSRPQADLIAADKHTFALWNVWSPSRP